MKTEFSIADRVVGHGRPCFVIAEAGVNHNCDVDLGRRLVDSAQESGADAIKFQSYKASKISTRVAPRYWVEPDDPKGTQWDTFDRLDKLSDADFRALLAHARKVGLTAFSTPFDDEVVFFEGKGHRAGDLFFGHQNCVVNVFLDDVKGVDIRGDSTCQCVGDGRFLHDIHHLANTKALDHSGAALH